MSDVFGIIIVAITVTSGAFVAGAFIDRNHTRTTIINDCNDFGAFVIDDKKYICEVKDELSR